MQFLPNSKWPTKARLIEWYMQRLSRSHNWLKKPRNVYCFTMSMYKHCLNSLAKFSKSMGCPLTLCSTILFVLQLLWVTLRQQFHVAVGRWVWRYKLGCTRIRQWAARCITHMLEILLIPSLPGLCSGLFGLLVIQIWIKTGKYFCNVNYL